MDPRWRMATISAGSAAVLLGLFAALLAFKEPNRLFKRVFGIPAEMSGPHEYVFSNPEEVFVAGSADFAFCALSKVDGGAAKCEAVRRSDGWSVRGSGGACAVTCLK